MLKNCLKDIYELFCGPCVQVEDYKKLTQKYNELAESYDELKRKYNELAEDHDKWRHRHDEQFSKNLTLEHDFRTIQYENHKLKEALSEEPQAEIQRLRAELRQSEEWNSELLKRCKILQVLYDTFLDNLRKNHDTELIDKALDAYHFAMFGKLEDLDDIPVRAFNCLKRSGIETVAQLLEYSKDELMEKCRQFGKASADAVVLALANHGLYLPKSPRTPETSDEQSESSE